MAEIKNTPKISIVIPCYNDNLFIWKSVDSAINQVYENKEIIVVDDGSNDQTKRAIEELGSKIDVLITQENLGPAAARNRGIEVAKGKYILVLDSDDYFEASYCKKAVKVLQQKEEVKVVTCYARWFKSKTNFRVFKPTGGTLKDFLLKNCTLSNSLFYRSDWEKCGGYDEKMTGGFEDWEYYIRLHADGGETYVIPEVLFHYRKKERSVSSIANGNKFELLKYIYFKHADLYKEHYELFIEYFLQELAAQEREKVRKTHSPEFKIGLAFLQPVRKLKSIFINHNKGNN